MSQAGILNVAGGGGGGSPIQTLTGDSGVAAVPVANNINILTDDDSSNNNNGIRSQSGFPTADDVTIFLTNRITGTVETSGATTDTVITFLTPNTAGVYQLTISVVAFDSGNTSGSTYDIYGAVKADGLGGIFTIGSPVRTMDGDIAFFDVTQVDVSISGLSIIVTVTGKAGRTIRWTGLMTYVFGGA